MVCHYGITTPQACGNVFAANTSASVSYNSTGSGTRTIQHVDEICGLSQPGDSGGPASDYTYRGAATGINIAAGTYSGCSGGHSFIEEGIFPILEQSNTYIY